MKQFCLAGNGLVIGILSTVVLSIVPLRLAWITNGRGITLITSLIFLQYVISSLQTWKYNYFYCTAF